MSKEGPLVALSPHEAKYTVFSVSLTYLCGYCCKPKGGRDAPLAERSGGGQDPAQEAGKIVAEDALDLRLTEPAREQRGREQREIVDLLEAVEMRPLHAGEAAVAPVARTLTLRELGSQVDPVDPHLLGQVDVVVDEPIDGGALRISEGHRGVRADQSPVLAQGA